MNDIKIEDYPYALRHMGKNGCGGAVCYLKRKPKFASILRCSECISTDGTEIALSIPFLCGTCGKGEVGFNTPWIFNRKEEIDRQYFKQHWVKGLEDWDYE